MPKKPFDKLPEGRRGKILRACLVLFARHGFERTSIKMIARKVGVADGYLYYYFKGKREIAQWAAEAGLAAWDDHFRQYVTDRSPQDLFEFFRLSLVQSILFIRKHPDLYGAYDRLFRDPAFPLAGQLMRRLAGAGRLRRDFIEKEIAEGRMNSNATMTHAEMLLDVVGERIRKIARHRKLDPNNLAGMNEEEISRFAEKIALILKNGLAAPPVAN